MRRRNQTCLSLFSVQLFWIPQLSLTNESTHNEHPCLSVIHKHIYKQLVDNKTQWHVKLIDHPRCSGSKIVRPRSSELL